MKKMIGIVGEGPTDYIVIKEAIDHITGRKNDYRRLQPEPDMAGRFGNGWKGVWKWCETISEILDQYLHEVTPGIDLLVIQMDADVSRKEKESHCLCGTTVCESREDSRPLQCEKVIKELCPIVLPCREHLQNSEGYRNHLEMLLRKYLRVSVDRSDIVITVPCDSTDAWIVAAYRDCENVEAVADPWENIIARKKTYHGIRIPGTKKSISVYSRLVREVSKEWNAVTEQCDSAKCFEDNIKNAFGIC